MEESLEEVRENPLFVSQRFGGVGKLEGQASLLSCQKVTRQTTLLKRTTQKYQ